MPATADSVATNECVDVGQNYLHIRPTDGEGRSCAISRVVVKVEAALRVFHSHVGVALLLRREAGVAIRFGGVACLQAGVLASSRIVAHSIQSESWCLVWRSGRLSDDGAIEVEAIRSL